MNVKILAERIRQRTALEDERWVNERTALAAALADHQREHIVHEQSHGREHQLAEQASAKAELSLDKRLHAVNEFREQLREQATHLATQEAFDAYRGETDRRFNEATARTDERFESNRKRIEAIEKGDVKAEGRGLGQSATIAAIVLGLTVAGVIVGLILNASRLFAGP